MNSSAGTSSPVFGSHRTGRWPEKSTRTFFPALHLPHRRGQGVDPALVVAAELAVAIAVGMGVEVLQPQALERDARAFELLVEPRHVRERPRDPDQVVDSLKEADLQLGVVQVVRERPVQPGLGLPGGSTRTRSPGRPHRRRPRPAGAGRRPTAVAGSRGSVASAASPSASRHLLWSEAPYRCRGATDACSRWPESPFGIHRNGRSGSPGTDVHDRSESAFRMLRNTQPMRCAHH